MISTSSRARPSGSTVAARVRRRSSTERRASVASSTPSHSISTMFAVSRTSMRNPRAVPSGRGAAEERWPGRAPSAPVGQPGAPRRGARCARPLPSPSAGTRPPVRSPNMSCVYPPPPPNESPTRSARRCSRSGVANQARCPPRKSRHVLAGPRRRSRRGASSKVLCTSCGGAPPISAPIARPYRSRLPPRTSGWEILPPAMRVLARPMFDPGDPSGQSVGRTDWYGRCKIARHVGGQPVPPLGGAGVRGLPALHARW